VAAYLRNHFGWGYAFSAAGIGMALGVIWFFGGNKHVKDADVIKPATDQDLPLGKIFLTVFLPLFVFGAIGWFIPGNLTGSDSTDAFIFASVPVAFFYLSLWWKASKEDKAPIAALLSIFAVVIIFWAIFHQNASALTVWAENYTDRALPASVEPFAETFGMVQEVDTSPRPVPKIDAHGRTVTDAEGKAITEMGPHIYFRNLPKDQWPPAGKSLKLLSTEIFQSINPFFVIILTPLVVGIFNFLGRRNKEPSTPGKIGLGLFITALSTLVMVGAVLASHNGLEKSSGMWLITSYGVVTVGELCLSPMGLSLVSKLSPPRLAALMMGGWFVATAFGNKLSGVLAGLWEMYDNKAVFFLINFAGAMLGALAILLMLRWLKRVVLEHTGQS